MEIERAGVFGQFEDIRADHRFAAGEQDGGDFESGQVIQNGFAFGGRKFIGIFLRGGIGVTVNAFEVAGSGEVPDDDGPALGGAFGDGHPLVRRRVDLGDRPAISVRRAGGFKATV